MVCGHYWRARTGLDKPFHKGVRRGAVDGIDVIELEIPYSQYDSLLKRSFIFFMFAARSVKIALTEKYDLLFATSTPLTAGIPGIMAKLLRRKPFVFEVRDLWPELPREMGVIRNPIALSAMSLLEWISYRAANGCIGLSPGIVQGIKRRSRKDIPVVMVPNGSDIDLFKPSQDKRLEIPGVQPGDFCAVFTGAHGIANGLHRVLDAAAALKRRSARRIKIVLIGDGGEKKALMERAKHEGLINVVFHDPIPKLKLADMLGRFNVGLQILDNIPAFYYGTSPNKFFDYLAAGLPVLTNYPGWIADLLRDYQCGIAVAPDDPEAFAAALADLAGNPQRCEEFGRNSRLLAEREFSRDLLVSRWEQFVTSFGSNKP